MKIKFFFTLAFVMFAFMSTTFAQVVADGKIQYGTINEGKCKIASWAALHANGQLEIAMHLKNNHLIKGTHGKVWIVFRDAHGAPLFRVSNNARGVNAKPLGGNDKHFLDSIAVDPILLKATRYLTIEFEETNGPRLYEKGWYKDVKQIAADIQKHTGGQ